MATERQPVLVTGATGRIGRQVVDELVVAGAAVRALTRRPADAGLPGSVEVVAGDFTDPDSLGPALRDVEAVFLVWTLPLAPAPAVIERLATTAKRVVLLSSPHQTPHPFFQQPNPAAKLHADLERLVAASGLAAAIIRPGMFASNAVHWWSAAIKSGAAVRWPYAMAETAPIDERDVAAVAARLLVDGSRAPGDFVLTGPESLRQAEQIRIIGDAIDQPIRVVDVSPEEFRAETAETWPKPVVEMLLAAWAATMGRPAYVTSDVLEVTGSPARTFAQWAGDHAEAFR